MAKDVGPPRAVRYPSICIRRLQHLALLAPAMALSCTLFPVRPQYPSEPPGLQREFRGVWVATVANIDWPSAPGLGSDRQRLEALAILDRCRVLNFNAVILQVRPQCDVIFPSSIEPWSYFLSGAQGDPPDPPYDPLQFWIDEAHARGLELHAWLNPFRANHPRHVGEISPRSVIKTRPDLALRIGEEGYYWLDPGREEARRHTLSVMREIATQYEIDGIHVDDYFYPYPSYIGGGEFPDDDSWAAYQSAGGTLHRGDWRRGNVNEFVRALYDSVRGLERPIKLGISPFGIWRPGHPPGIESGIDQYETLYADVRLWLRQGWLDYLAPQLYWRISAPAQSFPRLLTWWQRQNLSQRHVWPGIYASKVTEGEWPPEEILQQVVRTRDLLASDPGNIHFSVQAFMGEGRIRPKVAADDALGLSDLLGLGPYRARALMPRFPWLDSSPPPSPTLAVRTRDDRVELTWRQGEGEEAFVYVVYAFDGADWSWDIVPGSRRSHAIDWGDLFTPAHPGRAAGGLRFAVAAVDRFGNLSPPAGCELQGQVLTAGRSL